MLDEVINMLAAVRDAAAADTYSALLPSASVDNDSTKQKSQHPPSTTTHSHQQQQPRRRVPLRSTSVASIDLRDPNEI